MTLSSLSSTTRPCICPATAMPLTLISKPCISSLIPSSVLTYQSLGSCSDHSGLGKYKGYSFDTIFSIFPLSFISKSLTAEVPKSMPTNIHTPHIYSQTNFSNIKAAAKTNYLLPCNSFYYLS